MDQLVGRDAELGLVAAWLDEPSAMPSTIFLEGDPGAGKTSRSGVDEEGSATVNAWNNACGEYDIVVTEVSGGGWDFEEDTQATISLYPDGTYQVSWSASGYDREVVLPGEEASQWSESAADCPAGSDTSNAPMYPNPVIGSGETNRVEGKIDPDNPGNRLSGSTTVTNYDLSVTTIRWNLIHDGPIRLPGGG